MNSNPAILYVEDDVSSRKVMRLILAGRMKLSNLVFFEDSQDFTTRVKTLDPHPDIVFLDIHVKPHNGFEMLKMLRGVEEFRKTPIVALTASVMNEEVLMLKTAGFDGCLSKPVDADTFPDIFSRIMGGEMIWHIL